MKNYAVKELLKDKDIIGGCVLPFNIKEKLDGILEGDVEILSLPIELQRLLIGILSTKENPFHAILITIRALKQKYNSEYSDFLSKIKKLEIKDEEEGLIILNDLFKKYCSEHESFAN